MTEPTDDELAKLFTEATGFDTDDFPAAIFDFALAVLAKWGTPAPVGVEPYGWHYWNIAGTSVLHLERSNKLDADIAASKEHPGVHHVVSLYTTPQPAQAAQAACCPTGAPSAPAPGQAACCGPTANNPNKCC